jgi:dTMP kinase
MSARAGRLIVFEGVEGAGKTTQLDRLSARFGRAGIAWVRFREPGGTAAGDRIRQILLDPGAAMDARTEALLFMASRAELVATAVRPALSGGAVVLLDRFFLSTYAYQIDGRGLAEPDVRAANAAATGGLVPDLTLLLSMPSGEGLARAQQRGPSDRMERSGPAFHARVEAAFARFVTPAWQASHPEAGRVVVVDAAGSPEDVEQRVVAALTRHLSDLRAAMERVA